MHLSEKILLNSWNWTTLNTLLLECSINIHYIIRVKLTLLLVDRCTVAQTSPWYPVNNPSKSPIRGVVPFLGKLTPWTLIAVLKSDDPPRTYLSFHIFSGAPHATSPNHAEPRLRRSQRSNSATASDCARNPMGFAVGLPVIQHVLTFLASNMMVCHNILHVFHHQAGVW